jgi:hypothetical protein
LVVVLVVLLKVTGCWAGEEGKEKKDGDSLPLEREELEKPLGDTGGARLQVEKESSPLGTTSPTSLPVAPPPPNSTLAPRRLRSLRMHRYRAAQHSTVRKMGNADIP